jgi:Ca-activated chloride channel family protein
VLELLEASDAEDEYCVVRFSDSPEVLVRMTHDKAQVSSALYRIHPYGWTALLDGVHLATQEVRAGHNHRKAIVLISDGGDNRSRHTEKSVKRQVRETDAQIYSIGIVGPDDQLLYPVEVDGPNLMRKISNQSGGQLFLIHEIDDLPFAIRAIESAIRHQYVLGYYPTVNRADGKYRHVTVKLRSPEGEPHLKAYWRAGYYAPPK